LSTSKQTIEYLEDQLAPLPIRTAPMFGEYCVYLDEKVVGFVCDDVFLIKPTGAEESFFVGTSPGKPYPGAKDYHAVHGDLIENRDWLRDAVQATADAQPVPKPKKPRPRANGGGGR
jgi:TfoX/Sxy family transcriptional regulator of competence genes